METKGGGGAGWWVTQKEERPILKSGETLKLCPCFLSNEKIVPVKSSAVSSLVLEPFFKHVFCVPKRRNSCKYLDLGCSGEVFCLGISDLSYFLSTPSSKPKRLINFSQLKNKPKQITKFVFWNCCTLFFLGKLPSKKMSEC